MEFWLTGSMSTKVFVDITCGAQCAYSFAAFISNNENETLLLELVYLCVFFNYVCTYVCMYVFMYVHMYLYMYVCTYI